MNDGTVWLSAPTTSDVDAIAAACAHPSIGEWTTVPVPYTRADAELFVGTIVPELAEHGSPTWGIRTEPDGPVRGMIGFIARGPGVAEVGFWLAPAQRSRGLATRALKLMCGTAFEEQRFERIEWRAYVGNHGSAAVARSAGFRYEGLLRRGVAQRGVRRDCWLAALLPDDERAPADGWPDDV